MLAVLADIGMYAGGGYGNRDRIPGQGGYPELSSIRWLESGNIKPRTIKNKLLLSLVVEPSPMKSAEHPDVRPRVAMSKGAGLQSRHPSTGSG